jgi:hypothetical protein
MMYLYKMSVHTYDELQTGCTHMALKVGVRQASLIDRVDEPFGTRLIYYGAKLRTRGGVAHVTGRI